MQVVLDFLNNLQNNNNREWFEANRTNYLNAKNTFEAFVEKLISGISEFDTSIRNISVSDCTYRIYRDIRFSGDKTPYKTHMGAFISPYGKKGGYSGYYFHIEAHNADYIGGNILSAGIYRPEPKVLKSIREEIMLNGSNFHKAVLSSGSDFVLDNSGKLKKVPLGFPTDYEYSDYFRYKNYFLTQYVSDEFVMNDKLLENTLREFKKTLPFNNLLNKAIAYAYGTDQE